MFRLVVVWLVRLTGKLLRTVGLRLALVELLYGLSGRC